MQRLKVVRPDDADVNALLLEILIDSWSSYDCPTQLGLFLGLKGYVTYDQGKKAIEAELAKEKKGDATAARRWLQTIVLSMAFEDVGYGRSAADNELVLKTGKVLGVDVKKCFDQAEQAEPGIEAKGPEATEAKGTKAPSTLKKPKAVKKPKAAKAAKKAKGKGKRSE